MADFGSVRIVPQSITYQTLVVNIITISLSDVCAHIVLPVRAIHHRQIEIDFTVASATVAMEIDVVHVEKPNENDRNRGAFSDVNRYTVYDVCKMNYT